MIRVNPGQNRSVMIDHPLFDDMKKYTKEEIKELALKALESKEAKEALFHALKSCVAYSVGRYIYHWPSSRRFEYEMISEGFLVISELISEISLELVENYDILRIVGQRTIGRIDTYLSKNYGAYSTSVHKQRFDPINTDYVEINNLSEFNHPSDEGDVWKRDQLDAILSMNLKDHIDEHIMKKENWGKKYDELAKELDVSVGTIYYRRNKLYKQLEN